jgi:2-dehydropantoate 2-reductase
MHPPRITCWNAPRTRLIHPVVDVGGGVGHNGGRGNRILWKERGNDSMHILVMGTGGVGGYYGAMLAQAGHDVTFVARGAHLAAIREHGLEVRTQGQTIRIQPAKVVERPADAAGQGSGVDLALFTVKTYDTRTAAEALKPALGSQAAVLTLQNGVDSPSVLAEILGQERVLAGVTFIAASIAEPGVIVENGFSRAVTLGEPSGGEVTPRVKTIVHAFQEAGLDVQATADARQTLWEKFVVVAPHATISALCQTPIGVTRQTPEAMDLYRQMSQEALDVARAAGCTFAPDRAEQIVALFQTAPEGQTSSMQRDYAAQRRVELEALTGSVVRLGQQYGVPTPRFEALYAVLKVRAGTFGGLS